MKTRSVPGFISIENRADTEINSRKVCQKREKNHSASMSFISGSHHIFTYLPIFGSLHLWLLPKAALALFVIKRIVRGRFRMPGVVAK